MRKTRLAVWTRGMKESSNKTNLLLILTAVGVHFVVTYTCAILAFKEQRFLDKKAEIFCVSACIRQNNNWPLVLDVRI